MEKITINLLPREVKEAQRVQSKFYKVQAISIIVILTMIFLASVTFALGVLQSESIRDANFNLSASENKLSEFKSKEGALLILKNRASFVSQLTTAPSKQRTAYSLVSNLLPESVLVGSLEADRTGNLNLALVAENGADLDEFLANLVDPQKSEGYIKKVELDSFSRGRDGTYRANLKITIK